jgi:SSS family solute:Na+ symporter
MSWVDWSIVAGLMVFVTYTAITTKKHTKSVADFLAANRCAGRYLLGTAEGMASIGAMTVITTFELFIRTGFTKRYWESVAIPLALVLTLTGFVVYRYRATRAMTLGQFLEMRYSRKFRTYAGIVAWISGLINFGIFPAIGARFFINFCGFTNYPVTIGPLEINLTLAAVMLILISIALFFTFTGGQIAVLVTDFWQGLFCTMLFLSLIVFIWFEFPWSSMGEALVLISKPGESLIDPLDIAGKRDFNFLFFVIMWFFAVYYVGAWQGNQAYNCSATTPHEAKMGKVVGGLRGVVISIGLVLLALAAIAVLYHPDYADKAALVGEHLQNAFPGNETLQTQMSVPVALRSILPIGLLGGFAAAMLAFFISTNNTYMHSWGSIFVQDVLCMLRKKPLTQKEHLWYLRLSVIFVALFAFFFSLLFPLKEYLWMFITITSAIFLGGAGSVIIGGLYWKRGTTAAAWSAMTVGGVFSVGTIVLRTAWPHIQYLVENIGPEFPYNSQVMAFWAAVAAIVVYVVVSLLGRKPAINMDRLFRRGEYALEEEENELDARGAEHKPVGRFWKLIGVNSHEFSRVDKALFLYVVAISGVWVGSFLILLPFALTGRMTDQDWLWWWRIRVYIEVSIAFVGGTWVCVGGLFDLRKMYKRLGSVRRNVLDNGRVASDHMMGDDTRHTGESK